MLTGIAVLASNLVVGAWGAIAWSRHEPSVWFWYLLRFAQAVVVVQVTLGLILLATGHHAVDELHYVYGIAPLVVTVVTEGMRAGAAQRELDDYDDLEAEEVISLLGSLEGKDLVALRAYEEAGQSREAVLRAIDGVLARREPAGTV